ncbi:hypothetical protein NY78_0762 [Desulfovibrio sp. TomC]|nr:hypothetical protein NY78_0762 [Desulfovibrio sp. TomC]
MGRCGGPARWTAGGSEMAGRGCGGPGFGGRRRGFGRGGQGELAGRAGQAEGFGPGRHPRGRCSDDRDTLTRRAEALRAALDAVNGRLASLDGDSQAH